MLELLNSHPNRIRMCLGVTHDIFDKLVQELRCCDGITESSQLSIEEQLGIFLYTCVTGSLPWHVGERFQHSSSTITKSVQSFICISTLTLFSRCFKRVLIPFSSVPFYTSQVKFPIQNTLVSSVITSDPHFRFFGNCIGAVDGTHIWAFMALEDQPHMCNWKGYLSQNCLFVCDLNFFFINTLMGWDGSTADVTLWNNAHTLDLLIPQGKYLLADAWYQGMVPGKFKIYLILIDW